MPFTIKDFDTLTQEAQRLQRTDHALGEGKGGRLEIRRPLKAPGWGVQFRAWLGRKIGGFADSRARMEEHQLQVQEFQVSNRQMMQGFMQALQEKYGEHIANMAMVDVDLSGVTPLTSRTVTRAIEGAEGHAKSMRAWNNINIGFFLRAGLSGKRGGDQDMIGLFLDNGIQLGGHSSWQKALPKPTADCLEKLFQLKCEALPGYSKGRLSNEKLATLGQEVIDYLKELQGQTTVTHEKLQEILQRKVITTDSKTAQTLVNNIRDEVAKEYSFSLLDRKNPQSLFSKTLDSVLKESGYQGEIPDSVRKSITSDLTAEILMAKDLPRLLNSGHRFAEMKTALEKHVKGRCEQVVGAHLQAMKLLEKPLQGMTTKQQEALRQLGSQRRIDPVQVEQFKLACQWKGRFTKLVDALRNGDFKTAIRSLQIMGDENTAWINPCIKKARQMGCWTQFLAGESIEMLDDFVKVALAGTSPNELRAMVKTLTGPNAKAIVNTVPWVPLSTEGTKFKYLSPQLISFANVIAQMANVPTEGFEELFQPDQGAIARLPPGALLEMLAHNTDNRGVDQDSQLAQQLVRKDFDLQQFRNTVNKDVLTHLNKDPIDTDTGLSHTFFRDLTGCSFRLNGQALRRYGEKGVLLDEDPNIIVRRFQQGVQVTDSEGIIDVEKSQALAKAISLCMNQNGVQRMLGKYMEETLDGGSLIGSGVKDTDQETWRDEEGNWYVKSSTTYGVSMYEDKDQKQTLLDSNSSVVMTSVTYRISKESIAKGEPTIEIVDSGHYLSLEAKKGQ